jgi:hypothetical protein
MKNLFAALAVFLLLAAMASAAKTETPPGATYVGSEECSYCHQQEYENFSKYAKKAKSFQSIQIMASDLAPEEIKECYFCHTTGYGQPGGFVSFEQTPGLSDAGCEVCHGPGSEHVDMGGDPTLIKGDLDLADCTTCHNEERVRSFDFKPLLHGGAH